MSDFELDAKCLAQYLEANLDGFRGPLVVNKFAKGQSNPTYHLKASSGSYVLRRKPPGKLLKSAHAIDREFRILRALYGSSVPVAMPYHFCEDETVVGSVFYIMQFVEGTIHWDPLLPELNNEQRSAHYDSMNRVLADLHCLDISSLSLSDFGRPAGFVERQIELWSRQYRATETDAVDDMEWLLRKLPALFPGDDGRHALIHGDFRLDNMIFAHNDAQVLALMDWELSTLGHPFTDIAYQCMQLRIPHSGPMPGIGQIDRDAYGIPSEVQYVSNYCARMGLSGIPQWEFYLAFSFFRFAAILQGVKRRALDGNASSANALRMGEYVSPLARMGVELLA